MTCYLKLSGHSRSVDGQGQSNQTADLRTGNFFMCGLFSPDSNCLEILAHQKTSADHLCFHKPELTRQLTLRTMVLTLLNHTHIEFCKRVHVL